MARNGAGLNAFVVFICLDFNPFAGYGGAILLQVSVNTKVEFAGMMTFPEGSRRAVLP